MYLKTQKLKKTVQKPEFRMHQINLVNVWINELLLHIKQQNQYKYKQKYQVVLLLKKNFKILTPCS